MILRKTMKILVTFYSLNHKSIKQYDPLFDFSKKLLDPVYFDLRILKANLSDPSNSMEFFKVFGR